MTKQEFEQLSGIKVDQCAFDEINRMYIYAWNMSKQDFVKAYMANNLELAKIIANGAENAEYTARQEMQEALKAKDDEIQKLKNELAAREAKIDARKKEVKALMHSYIVNGEIDKLMAFKPIFGGENDELWTRVIVELITKF